MTTNSNSDERSADVISSTAQGDSPRTSIVFPAYNEAGNVTPLVSEVLEAFSKPEASPYTPIEIIGVDDGSTDGTRTELEELAAEISVMRTVVLRRNFGQSAALTAGINTADGDLIVTLDADGQNNPHDALELLDTLSDGYDCVSGWRKDRADPLSKRIPSLIQTRLAVFTGPVIHDFGCTLKAYRAAAVKDIQIYGEGHRYIPAKLHKRGYDVTEQPVSHRPRTSGQTKYNLSRLARGFMDLLFNIFWNRYSTRPLHFLGSLGLLLTAIGGILGSHAVMLKFVNGQPLTPHLPRLILIVALIIFGFQLVMFGFLAEMFTKMYYRDDRTYRIETIDDGD